MIPVYQLSLWTLIIAVKLLLFGTLFFDQWRRFPAFTSYVGYSAASSIFLYFINSRFGFEEYFWAYWLQVAFDAAFLLWVMTEVIRDIFKPFWTVPLRPVETAFYVIAPAAVCLTISAAIYPSSLPECFLRAARMYERAVTFNFLLLQTAVLLVSKYLCIPLRRRTSGILCGLSVSTLVQVAVAADAGTSTAFILGTMGMLGDLVGLMVWVNTFMGASEKSVEVPSEIQLLAMAEQLRLVNERMGGDRFKSLNPFEQGSCSKALANSKLSSSKHTLEEAKRSV